MVMFKGMTKKDKLLLTVGVCPTTFSQYFQSTDEINLSKLTFASRSDQSLNFGKRYKRYKAGEDMKHGHGAVGGGGRGHGRADGGRGHGHEENMRRTVGRDLQSNTELEENCTADGDCRLEGWLVGNLQTNREREENCTARTRTG